MKPVGKQKDQDKKKSYSSPVLHVYGTIEKLTQNIGMNGNPDGGMGGTMFSRP